MRNINYFSSQTVKHDMYMQISCKLCTAATGWYSFILILSKRMKFFEPIACHYVFQFCYGSLQLLIYNLYSEFNLYQENTQLTCVYVCFGSKVYQRPFPRKVCSHYNGVVWAPWCLKSPFTRLVVQLTIIGLENGLSPDRRQAIIWTNYVILSIRP